MSINIKKHPKDVQELVAKRAKEYEKKMGMPFMGDGDYHTIENAFGWTNSEEGYEFWDNIDKTGDYDEFYDKYPKKSMKGKPAATVKGNNIVNSYELY